LIKRPGCSWIEVNTRNHVFFGGDWITHTVREHICHVENLHVDEEFRICFWHFAILNGKRLRSIFDCTWACKHMPYRNCLNHLREGWHPQCRHTHLIVGWEFLWWMLTVFNISGLHYVIVGIVHEAFWTNNITKYQSIGAA